MDNQRVAILVLVVSICLFSLLFLFLRSHGSRKPLMEKGTGVTGKPATVRKDPVKPGTGGQETPRPSDISIAPPPGTPGSPAHVPGTPGLDNKHGTGGIPPLETTSSQPDVPPVRITPDTMAQLEEKAGRIRAHRRKVIEASENWLRERLDDENLTDKTKEVYRLRLLPNMKEGLRLLEAKDFQGALREFDKALEDPDATPVSKHLIHDYMLQAAGKMKNKLLYAELFKRQASLQRDHDLGVLGLDKSDEAFAYAESFSEHLAAANDEAALNRLVEKDMKNIGASSKDRDLCMTEAKQRIKEFEAFFDDRKN